ncbi:Flp family type IVb pilin [Salinicoccus sesuvii]|uniref:Flp family type IVb pilin n=1 Tax=Salinicoccus sesuvii TaxID=868281 RepID=A0ABV7N1Y4_9STAP
MMEFFKGLVMEEEGQGMTEYGLILGLLVAAVVIAFGLLTDQFDGIMTSLGNAISSAVGGSTE